MYGRYGQDGFFAGYGGSEVYENPAYGAFLVPVLIGLGVGAAGLTGGYMYSAHLAEEEMARHTGGTIRLPSGETVSADDAHWRLCASGIVTDCGPGSEPSSNNVSYDAEGNRYTVVPEGFWSAFADTMDPTTVFEHPEYLRPGTIAEELGPDDDPRKTIPKWVFWTAAAAGAAAFFYSQTQRSKSRRALGL